MIFSDVFLMRCNYICTCTFKEKLILNAISFGKLCIWFSNKIEKNNYRFVYSLILSCPGRYRPRQRKSHVNFFRMNWQNLGLSRYLKKMESLPFQKRIFKMTAVVNISCKFMPKLQWPRFKSDEVIFFYTSIVKKI